MVILDADRNNLKSLPDEFDQLSSLKNLNFSHNQITSFPPVILKLQGLERLDLSENALGSLPSEISQLSNLESLRLGRTELKTLPENIGLLSNLEHLFLGNNKLNEIPAEIGMLAGLRSLWLEFNYLKSLPTTIGRLHNLYILDIEGGGPYFNNLGSLPLELCQLPNLKLILGEGKQYVGAQISSVILEMDAKRNKKSWWKFWKSEGKQVESQAAEFDRDEMRQEIIEAQKIHDSQMPMVLNMWQRIQHEYPDREFSSEDLLALGFPQEDVDYALQTFMDKGWIEATGLRQFRILSV